MNKTEQETPFSEKTIKFRPINLYIYIYIYIYIFIFLWSFKKSWQLLEGWHLYHFHPVYRTGHPGRGHRRPTPPRFPPVVWTTYMKLHEEWTIAMRGFTQSSIRWLCSIWRFILNTWKWEYSYPGHANIRQPVNKRYITH